MSLSERQLFAGYGEMLRSEPCACGGLIVAPPLDDMRIRLAIEGHQATARHAQWRERMHPVPRSAQPTAEGPRDMSAITNGASAGQIGAPGNRTPGRFGMAGEGPGSYNSAVGISDTTIPNTMCDARSVADTSRAGVPRSRRYQLR